MKELKRALLVMGEDLVTRVFASVSFYGGKLASFSYESGGMCAVVVYGCDCRSVVSARQCVVSLKDGDMRLELPLPLTMREPYAVAVREKGAAARPREDEWKRVSFVRNVLRELGAFIECERNEEALAEFSFIVDGSVLYSCLKICGTVAEEDGWKELALSVTMEGCLCHVRVLFSKTDERGEFSPLLLCAQFAYLFAADLALVPKRRRLFSDRTARHLVPQREDGEVRSDSKKRVSPYAGDSRGGSQEEQGASYVL